MDVIPTTTKVCKGFYAMLPTPIPIRQRTIRPMLSMSQ